MTVLFLFGFYSFEGALNGFKKHSHLVGTLLDWLWYMNNVFARFGIQTATEMISVIWKFGWNMYDPPAGCISSQVSSYFWCSIFLIVFKLLSLIHIILVAQAENCADAEVIYSFLDANGIGKTHSAYYISYALHMESKNKLKVGNEILSLGLSR